MTSDRLKRLALIALIPAAMMGAAFTAAAQPAATPAAPPAASPAPAATATPAVDKPATAPEAPPSAPQPGTAEVPPTAASPQPPASQVEAAANDPFGEDTTLPSKTVVMTRGSAKWDSAFDTLMTSFKALNATLEKESVTANGNPLIIYTATDDAGFMYIAAIPVDQPLKNLPKTMSMGKSPEGKALKFVHRGSYDNMDNTYEAITNHLDDKGLEAKDTFIEEYTTDPLKTAEDLLVINVFVPMK